jgi:hypothetical protein
MSYEIKQYLAVLRRFCWLGAGTLLLAACGGGNQEDQVWDQYDVRAPLPYDSQVPDSAVNQIDRYDPYRYPPVDNDEYYQPPTTPNNSDFIN